MSKQLFSKQWWKESLELSESVPTEYEDDDSQDYIENQLEAINKAAAVFNLPISDMQYAFEAGKDLVLNDDEWSKLENSHSHNIESIGQVILYAKEHKINIKPYLEAVKNMKSLPKPLVLRYGEDKYYLVAGELVLSIQKALGLIPDVIQGVLNLQNGHNMGEGLLNLYSKEIQESINSDIDTWGMLPEYKIDLNDVYDYKKENDFYSFYDDVNQCEIIVKLKFQPSGLVEFKFYPVKDGKVLGFVELKHSNPKIMNTVYKIFQNEILPKYDKILIQPAGNIRYRLFKAMINNNLSKDEYNIDVKEDLEQPYIIVSKKTLNETKTNSVNLVEEFINFVFKELELKKLPEITFSNNLGEVKHNHSFGRFTPDSNVIWVYVGNRNMADIFRTLGHELVHRKQDEEGRIDYSSGDTGSEIENEANAQAGVLLRKFGKEHDDIYDANVSDYIKI